MSEPPAKAPSAEATQAGRGVIYIALAKFYFMVAGAVIEFRLPAILGNTVFGAYAVVSSMVSPVNNVLITGSIQAVSRFTAQKPELARAIQRAGLLMHLYIGLPVAITFIALAPVFSSFFHDDSKVGPLMLAGLIVAGYAFYAVFIGTVNGLKQFHKQALFDVCFATFRALGILGLATAGFGLYGALSGWVAAVAVILVVVSFVVGVPGRAKSKEDKQSLKPLIKFFAGVAVYLILLNMIMFVDQILLKRLSTEWFLERSDQVATMFAMLAPDWLVESTGELDASKLADVQVGYYRAVQNLARLAYQAIIAVTFVIFPLVSRTTFNADRDATARYIRTTMRYSLIFATAIAVVFAANPEAMLDIPYRSDYAVNGGLALIALSLGSVAFSLFAIIGTIFNGAGLTRQAIAIAAITLVIASVANAVAIPMYAPGRDVLLACGAATGGSMVIGATIGGLWMRKKLGAFIPLATIIRVALGVAAAIAVGQVIPFTTPLMTLVEATIVGMTFLITLVVTRELTAEDLRSVLGVVRGRKGTS